jgi:hypothetical protein
MPSVIIVYFLFEIAVDKHPAAIPQIMKIVVLIWTLVIFSITARIAHPVKQMPRVSPILFIVFPFG